MVSELPSHPVANGTQLGKADEVQDLLDAVKSLIVPFIRAADSDAAHKGTGHGLQTEGQGPRTALVEHHPPQKLQALLGLDFPAHGTGRNGLLELVQGILKYSVNTWDQGFMDKLYASTNAVGVVSELLLAVLNTNVHVYQVSPALTLIEKHTTKALAKLFGFDGPHSGGISQPGGSASNQTSIVIARNTLYPETKTEGIQGRKYVLFTSAHGHYSLEKAAQMFGFGSSNVRGVAVNEQGQMRPDALAEAIDAALQAGETPFYVNATAGTTVLGSYDDVGAIAEVLAKYQHTKTPIWLHVDGSWGGPVVFSQKHRATKLRGIERADSIGVTPHKMLSVPMTCSFLLCKDMRNCQKAMTLPAGYLFHNPEEEADASAADTDALESKPNLETPGPEREAWDLADLTPQCGRKGDALKMALAWIYYGTSGLEERIDIGFDNSKYMAEAIESRAGFTLVSENPPPCWQVCFYYNKQEGVGHRNKNSKMTEEVAKRLIPKGFMVDYAPGEDGKFFRVVVNGGTNKTTIDGLIKAIEEIGKETKI